MLEAQLHHRQQAGGHWTVNGVNRCWVVALVSAAQYPLIQHWNIYLHKPHSNIDSADGPIGSHTQNSERSVLENCLNQCQLLLLLSELHLEILKLC